jgi:hypothetical protein
MEYSSDMTQWEFWEWLAAHRESFVTESKQIRDDASTDLPTLFTALRLINQAHDCYFFEYNWRIRNIYRPGGYCTDEELK